MIILCIEKSDKKTEAQLNILDEDDGRDCESGTDGIRRMYAIHPFEDLR